ncbi:glycoside hydrolase family 15 protein [Saccharopolyspora sp. K220]|uniref:glycoside hydrolase family 15 protein n=1 Tax=Saccharopolyspora soli TaxID=2926618 RepID=UPI001F599A37|nr:glycoside hydrolase family 15 protein [Saccharopolyspora soli]MCI2419306.1 glycoside hydrolase family 15 protein [Saccharopolyspora soli]
MTDEGHATGFAPIAEHGVIGDMRTAALVATDGAIDWFCCPQFDSPSVFGSIVGADRGGSWKIAPESHVDSHQQFYVPDSNVLITRFLTDDGVVEIHDFMPILRSHDPEHRQRLVRKVVSVRGSMRMRADVAPRFDYGRAQHRTTRGQYQVTFRGPGLTLALNSSVAQRIDEHGDAHAEFEMSDRSTEVFVLEVLGQDAEPGPGGRTTAEVDELFLGTVAFWREWLGNSSYRGRWRETVNRSALVLKLLTHEPSGSMIAAPTTSLPERLGGARNWDYRYVWLRDAAFSLSSLLRLGFIDEADAFMTWMTCRFAEVSDSAAGPLHVMYDVDCRRDLTEISLDHWAGHRGARPVRIGNDAVDQLQLDIYGEIIDAIYLFNKHGRPITHDSWLDLIGMVDWLQDNWDRADSGIWESRAGPRLHTFSRLMSWVAFERVVQIARQRGLPGNLESWVRTRDEIYWQIMSDGWSEKRRAFVQHYDEDVLDASLLLMPMMEFVAPTDPRFLSTLDAITENLVTDSLVFRYDYRGSPDGLDEAEGTFSICSFWYVEALTRAGRLEDARLVLEKMFTYANHLGLYAEQIGLTGDQLGNFPQAFTHLSLISAAMNLDRALG